MSDVNNSNLQEKVTELYNSLEGKLQWRWDGRFETALAEFGTDKQEEVKSVLDGFFGDTWETTNLVGATNNVKVIDYLFGGLMYGQLLLTSNPKESLILYCVWWPWGDQKTISIRIGYYDETLSDDGKSQAMEKFQKWFGL